jgi:DNA-binding CsgD family transcriptional regulator
MLALETSETRLRRQIGKLIASLGEDAFQSELLTTLNKLFRVDMFAIFPFDRDDRLLGIMAASRPTTDLARDLAYRFCDKYWRGDIAILGAKNQSLSDGPRHWRTRWNEVPSEEVKQDLYCRVGIVEKMSTRLSLSSGKIIWSVYRRDEFFTHEEFELFREMSDVISAAITTHLRLAELSFPTECDRPASRSTLLSSIERRAPHLSRREWEVCEGIAQGKTTNVIAHELGVKFSSVLTYKKRIYDKLGVATQRELMAVMLRDSTSSRNLGKIADSSHSRAKN